MEQLCRDFCSKIYSSTRDGCGIFYEDEFLDILPEGERTREVVEATLKKLMNEGYIDVKYAKGSAFCIAGLKPYVEICPAAEGIKPAVPQGGAKKHVLNFAAAFAGGALGSLLCGVIFYAFAL